MLGGIRHWEPPHATIQPDPQGRADLYRRRSVSKSSEECGCCPGVGFPAHLLRSQQTPQRGRGASATAEAKDSALLAALTEAKKALQDCVSVMSNDLGGLKLIQPELASARQALAAVDAVLVVQ